MTEKELKKLNRYQLLELIILQTEQITDLEKQLKTTRSLLENQQIQVAQAGSIAEAALQLSGIFEAAQTAADTYLANVKIHTENADRIEDEARTQAQQILSQAQAEADSILAGVQEKANRLLSEARQQADTDIRTAQIMLEETTRRCAEKEEAVNSYISNIRQAFHTQFQNLDQITKL